MQSFLIRNPADTQDVVQALQMKVGDHPALSLWLAEGISGAGDFTWGTQTFWTNLVGRKAMAAVRASASLRDRTRLHIQQRLSCASWALPLVGDQPPPVFLPESYRACLRWWLGMVQTPLPTPCLQCGTMGDIFGDHARHL